MIIALSGYATSGKDTVADILVEDFGFHKYAWADTLRMAAEALDPIISCTDDGTSVTYTDALETYGYNTAKALFPEFRRILQVLGTEVGRNLIGDNVWVDATLNRVKRERSEADNIVFTDTRFPNEANAVIGLDGWVVRVHRPGVGAANDHPSETSLDDFFFDQHVHNNGDIDALRTAAHLLVDHLEKNTFRG